MVKNRYRILMVGIISMMLVLSGCSGEGGGSGDASQGATTKVSGKVSLSSVVGGKPRLVKAPQGKPGSARYKATVLQKAPFSDLLPTSPVGAPLGGALVYLFDASHPEWLSPVASGIAGSDGIFTMDVLANAELNDNAYTNGDPIPAGKYTMQAVGFDPTTGEFSMALQSVVRDFTGASEEGDNELVAQSSEVKPAVQTMLGLTRNTDGTQTWGSASTTLPPSAAIQVAFSVAMNRASIENGITIVPAVDGSWAVSADWLTATLYLNDGVSLAAGEYTVTVNGEDSTDSTAVTVKNVYLNKLEKTATATFTVEANAVADSAAPSAIIVSPNTNSDVSITTPIRVASNEILDVNGLLLAPQTPADPSFGAQPGVQYVGEDLTTTTQYKYIYEFLGVPLKLGKSYKVSVSGGRDLSGNPMDELKYSFATETTAEGVTPITLSEGETGYEEAVAKADDQADVKDIFGKWARAMDDRNLAQVQSLMHGEFTLEYNVLNGYNPADEDRSGYYDLNEFGNMLSQAFLFWDLCQTTMSGDVVGDITIGASGDVADFEFLLTGTSANPSKECADGAPKDAMFANLVKINGSWVMSKASEGIDTRTETVQAAEEITLTAPLAGAEVVMDDTTVEMFSWTEIADATAYVMMFVDVRDPQSGFAFVLPPSYLEVEIPANEAVLFSEQNPIAAEVSEAFGFTREFNPRPGVEIDWQIVALGSNTVQDVLNDRATSLPKDIIGTSKPSRFSLAGDYQELTIEVTTAAGASVPFSEFIGGYDAGDADMVTITVTTPRLDASMGIVNVSGNTFSNNSLNFSVSADGMSMVGSVDIDLSQGNNGIEVADENIYQSAGGIDCPPEGCPPPPALSADCVDCGGPSAALFEWFNIKTTGGTAPVLAITSVSTDVELGGGAWDFYDAGASDTVTIAGTVSDSSITQLYVNLWNDKQGARGFRDVTVTNGTFSVDMSLYTGENWIDIGGSSTTGNWYSANFGVQTTEGIPWVPPFAIATVEYVDALGTIVKRDDWGDGGNWEATPADTTSAGRATSVVITGSLEFFTDAANSDNIPRYNVGSEGGWSEDRLSVDNLGDFTLTIDLFTGWNNVGINDVQGNFYNLNIQTEFGMKVIRPEVTKIDTTVFDATTPFNGEYATTQCFVTIEGTATEGQMYAYWNGSVNDPIDPMNSQYFWEEIRVDADADGMYSITVPLIGNAEGTADNFIDIYDKNWNWMSVRVINTGSCVYTEPAMTVSDPLVGMMGTTAVSLVKAQIDSYPDYNDPNKTIESGARFSTDATNPWMTVDVDSLTITGTSTVPGRTIGAEMWVCNAQVKSPSVTADTTETTAGSGLYAWSLPVTLYPGSNNISVSDGKNWYSVGIDANNTNTPPPPPMTVVLMDGSTTLVAAGGGTDPTGLTGTADPCAASNLSYDLGTSQSAVVTVTGTTTGTQDGEGEWYADGGFGRFPIVGGAFSFEIAVYEGYNWVNINDADWNNANVSITAANGNLRPRFVDIDNALTGVMPGPVTFTGTIYGKGSGGSSPTFVPQNVGASLNLCDSTGCSWMDFSSDPNAAEWGSLPLTFAPIAGSANGDYTFSFDVDLMADESDATKAGMYGINIYVDGDDGTGNGGWQGHGMNEIINDNCTGCNNSNYWKAGKAANKAIDMKTLTHIKAAMSKGGK